MPKTHSLESQQDRAKQKEERNHADRVQLKGAVHHLECSHRRNRENLQVVATHRRRRRVSCARKTKKTKGRAAGMDKRSSSRKMHKVGDARAVAVVLVPWFSCHGSEECQVEIGEWGTRNRNKVYAWRNHEIFFIK